MNNGWISVKERLPERDKKVLICLCLSNTYYYITGECHIDADDDEIYWWFDDESFFGEDDDVIAWMPIPLYKED